MVARNRLAPNSNEVSVSCPPGWLWLLAGIVIGMFVSFLIYLQEFSPNAVPPEQALAPPPSIENTPRTSSTTPPPPPPAPPVAAVEEPPQHFQFYDLPNAEPETPENPVTNTPPPTPTGQYILQVGLFRNPPQAEGLKKYLVSLNIVATVEETINTEGKWYRVQVGPFSDLDKLNQMRDKLKANNLPAILVEK